MKAGTTETEIVADVIRTLRTFGFPAWRNNTGMLPNPKGRPVRFGVVGMPDVVGIVPGPGRMLGIECKRPGEMVPDHQLAQLRAINEAGGVAFVIFDPRTLDSILLALRADPREVINEWGRIVG